MFFSARLVVFEMETYTVEFSKNFRRCTQRVAVDANVFEHFDRVNSLYDWNLLVQRRR